MPDSRQLSFEGREPDVHGNAHVARGATLVGEVTVESNASVWPGVVLRGDVDPVYVGEQSHVGDNASVHAAHIGDRVMIGHNSVINDAEVGNGSLVGFNATVDEAIVGERCVVASGTVVEPGMSIPDNSFAAGVPAQVRPLEETTVDVEGLFNQYHTGEYANLAARHKDLFM